MARPGLGDTAEARWPAILMPHYSVQFIGAKARDELRASLPLVLATEAAEVRAGG